MSEAAFVSVMLFFAAFVWFLGALLQWNNLRKQEVLLAALMRTRDREQSVPQHLSHIPEQRARRRTDLGIRLP